MAIQPTAARTAVQSQFRPVAGPATPRTSLGMLAAVITALMLSMAGIGLAIMNAPAPVVVNPQIPEAMKVANADIAPVEEGKEFVAKIAELESKLKQSQRDVQKLNEDMQSMLAQIEGLSANLAIVQSKSAETQIPVSIQPPQPEPTPTTPGKKN